MKKRAIALVIIWGILLMITALALASIYLMGNEARIAEHKVKRTMAYYLARAAWVYAFDKLRNNIAWSGESNFSFPAGENNNLSADITVGDVNSTGTILDGTKKVTISVNY